MDSALEKSILGCLEVFRKLIRSSEGGFMKKTLMDHKGLVGEIQHLFLGLSSTYPPIVTSWEK